MSQILTDGNFLFVCFIAVIALCITIASVVRNMARAYTWGSYYKHASGEVSPPLEFSLSDDDEDDTASNDDKGESE